LRGNPPCRPTNATASWDQTAEMTAKETPGGPVGDYGFVVVACRLSADRADSPGRGTEWRPSPGGLVSALEPIMREADGTWVGWADSAGDGPCSFDVSGMHPMGVGLSAEEVRYYEGFCNATPCTGRSFTRMCPRQQRRSGWQAC
jgi:trehalose-6-phosphate synthase